MGIMRRRSIFEDTNRLPYGLLPDLLILTAIHAFSLCVGVTSYQSKMSYNYRYTQLNPGY